MKTVYNFYMADNGEMEGMFDDKFQLMGAWSCNDANWRGEYFNGFMEELGISVKPMPKARHAAAVKAINAYFGLDE